MNIIRVVFLLTFLLSISVYSDPSRNLTFDDFPTFATYTIQNDGAGTFWATYHTGAVSWSGSDDDTTIQNAINNTMSNGGIVYVRQGTYTADVTVYSDVVLILEAGTSGVTYTLSGTGMCLRYVSGYVVNDAPLNMTGNQIVYGLFHAGSTRPTSPSEAQFFYDTDDHALLVYNGTAWEDYSGVGTTGAKGDAGEGTFGDYTFLVYYNSTASEYKFRDWQGVEQESDADPDNIFDWTIGNSTQGDIIHAKGATYTLSSSIDLVDGVTLILDNGVILNQTSTGTNVLRFDGISDAHVIGRGNATLYGAQSGSDNVVYMLNSEFCTLRDLEIQHGSKGVEMSNIDDCVLDTLHVNDMTTTGMRLNARAQRNRFLDLDVDATGCSGQVFLWYCTHADGMHGNEIIGGRYHDSDAENGIYLNSYSNGEITWNRIIGVECYGNDGGGRAGIKLNPASWNIIQGCILHDNYYGIMIGSSQTDGRTIGNNIDVLCYDNPQPNVCFSAEGSGANISLNNVRATIYGGGYGSSTIGVWFNNNGGGGSVCQYNRVDVTITYVDDGVMIGAGCDYNAVSGTILGANTYGVRIADSTCDKNVFSCGFSLGCGTNWSDAGTGTVRADSFVIA